MNVVIPVAGVGTRLRPHTFSTPKPLLRVAGKPILAHILDPIAKLNPKKVVFVVGFMGEQIVNWVRNEYRFESVFVQQDNLLGLGYALHLALGEVSDEPLLVVLGDTIVGCDLSSFVNSGPNVLGLSSVTDPHRFGIAEISKGRVTGLEEKPENPKSDLAIVGLYYFSKAASLKNALMTHVKSRKLTRGEIQFTDALQMMISSGEEFVPVIVKEWYDCGKKETMLATSRHFLTQLTARPAPKLHNSLLCDPVYVEEDCEISNSVIGPYVSIASKSVIKNSIIRNSIIGHRAELESMILRDSIVGDEVILSGSEQIVNIGQNSSNEHVATQLLPQEL